MNAIPIFLVMSLVCVGVGTLALGYDAAPLGAAGAFVGAGLFAIADALKTTRVAIRG